MCLSFFAPKKREAKSSDKSSQNLTFDDNLRFALLIVAKNRPVDHLFITIRRLKKDSECSDEVRCILSQHNQSVAGDMTGRKIRFRIKPAPRTPLQNHKFCLFDCFLNKFSQVWIEFSPFSSIFQSSSSFYSLLCLRYDWIQVKKRQKTLTRTFSADDNDIVATRKTRYWVLVDKWW